MEGHNGNGMNGKEHKAIPIDERFITSIQGKEFVLYAGLLDLAHKKGLKKLVVDIIQYPSKENDLTAVCRAVAENADGEIFTDIGDANPVNVNKKIINHIIRMASTRAKARCLRDMTNIGITCLEELGELNGDEVIGTETPAPKTVANGYHDQKPDGNGTDHDQNIPKASTAQLKAIENIAKRLKAKDDVLDKMIRDQYGVTLADLSAKQASDFIRFLQKAA